MPCKPPKNIYISIYKLPFTCGLAERWNNLKFSSEVDKIVVHTRRLLVSCILPKEVAKLLGRFGRESATNKQTHFVCVFFSSVVSRTVKRVEWMPETFPNLFCSKKGKMCLLFFRSYFRTIGLFVAKTVKLVFLISLSSCH